MKVVKIFLCDFGGSFNKENNRFINILKKHYTVQLTPNNPDFLIYGALGAQHLKFSNCVKIMYCGEPVIPNFSICDYAISLNPIQFGDRHLQIRNTVTYQSNEIEESMTKRKFCNFIYSNDFAGEGALIRKKFASLLSNYRTVDCPGRVLNNMKNAIEPRNGNWEKGKLDFIKNYKFTIAFENCSMPGVITEKLVQPFEMHSVPIYWGDPEIHKRFNVKSFVNVHDFKNFHEAIEYVKFLDTHDDAYLDMLHQKPMNDGCEQQKSLEEFLCSIISKGNNPVAKNPVMRNDHTVNCICEQSLSLSTSFLELNDLQRSKKNIEFCLQLETDRRLKAYPILEDIYYDDQENLLKFLKQRKELLMRGKSDPVILRELGEIGKCLMHQNMVKEAEIISGYIMEEDPYSELPQIIEKEKNKKGGKGIRPQINIKISSDVEVEKKKILNMEYWDRMYHDASIGSAWNLRFPLPSSGGKKYCGSTYNFFYPLYRILEDYHPKEILEFNFDEATKMTMQYSVANKSHHIVIANDKERVEHYIKCWKMPLTNTTIYGDSLLETRINQKTGVCYKNFNAILKNKRCDLILIKCPVDDRRIQMDMLSVLMDVIRVDFIILMDHVEDECGKMVFDEMINILRTRGIESIRKDFSTEDRIVSLLASATQKYILDI